MDWLLQASEVICRVFVQSVGQYSVHVRFLCNQDEDAVHDASTVLKFSPNPHLLRESNREVRQAYLFDTFYFAHHFISFQNDGCFNWNFLKKKTPENHYLVADLNKNFIFILKTILKLLDSSGYPILVSLSWHQLEISLMVVANPHLSIV